MPHFIGVAEKNKLYKRSSLPSFFTYAPYSVEDNPRLNPSPASVINSGSEKKSFLEGRDQKLVAPLKITEVTSIVSTTPSTPINLRVGGADYKLNSPNPVYINKEDTDPLMIIKGEKEINITQTLITLPNKPFSSIPLNDGEVSIKKKPAINITAKPLDSSPISTKTSDRAITRPLIPISRAISPIASEGAQRTENFNVDIPSNNLTRAVSPSNLKRGLSVIGSSASTTIKDLVGSPTKIQKSENLIPVGGASGKKIITDLPLVKNQNREFPIVSSPNTSLSIVPDPAAIDPSFAINNTSSKPEDAAYIGEIVNTVGGRTQKMIDINTHATDSILDSDNKSKKKNKNKKKKNKNNLNLLTLDSHPQPGASGEPVAKEKTVEGPAAEEKVEAVPELAVGVDSKLELGVEADAAHLAAAEKSELAVGVDSKEDVAENSQLDIAVESELESTEEHNLANLKEKILKIHGHTGTLSNTEANDLIMQYTNSFLPKLFNLATGKMPKGAGFEKLRTDCRAHISTVNCLAIEGHISQAQASAYKDAFTDLFKDHPKFISLFREEDNNLNNGVDANNPNFKIGNKIIIYGSVSQKQHINDLVTDITKDKKKLQPTLKMLKILTNLKGEIAEYDYGLIDKIEELIFSAKNLEDMRDYLKAYKVYKLCLKEFNIITDKEYNDHSEELGELVNKNKNPEIIKWYKSAKKYV